MTGRKRRLIVVNGCLAAVVLVLAAGAYVLLFRDDPSTAGASGQRTVEVSRGTVEVTVSATGTVDPARFAGADFATDGTVEKVKVDEGDSVDEGDVLARLDDTAAKQALDAAETMLTAAQQALDEMQDEEECEDGTSSSGGQTGAAQDCVTPSQLTQAQADVDAAAAEVSSAEDDVDATKLRAPMSGKVVAVNGTVGSSAAGSTGEGSGSESSGSGENGGGGGGGTGGTGSSGSTSTGTLDTDAGFVVIADTDDMVVNASFAEADVAELEKSQRADVTFPALSGAKTGGKVRSVALAPSGDGDVVRYDVRVSLPKPPEDLRLGQTAQLSVVVDRATDVLTVPSIAVSGTGSQATVKVLENGKTRTKSVTTGLRGDANTEIESGLEEGDEVVVATATKKTGQGGQGGGEPPGAGGGGPQPERVEVRP